MPVKRCPLCHRTSESTAWQCSCGYEFGQSVDQALELLRDQRTTARFMLGAMLLLDLLAIGFVIFMALHGVLIYPILGLAVLFGVTARVVRKLSVTRASIRQLTKRELPKASLREP